MSLDAKLVCVREYTDRTLRDVYSIWTDPGYLLRREKLIPLVVEKHLRNEQPIAIHLVHGETIRLAAFDIDDKGGVAGWGQVREAARKLSEAAVAQNLKPHVFRSGGGHGAHIFFLFDKHQNARAVRHALRLVLGAAGFLEGTRGVLHSEAEIYPKQDSVEAGHFGNCIALPGARACAPLNPDTFEIEEWHSVDWIARSFKISPPVPELTDDDFKPSTFQQLPGDETEVREALKFIQADDYGRWLRVAFALKHTFGNSMYSTFEAWSAAVPAKFDGAIACRRFWDCLKPNGRVGIGTIFRLARLNGWNGPQDQFVRELNAEYGMLIHGNQTQIIRKLRDPDEDFAIGKGPFSDLLAGRDVAVNGRNMPLAKAWLNHPRASKYMRIEFDPSLEPGHNGDAYNLWLGFAVEPTTQGSWELLKDHIRLNICSGNAEHYEWMLNWMALVVQRRGEPAGTAPVLIGLPGTGKGEFARHFGSLWGPHYIEVTHSEHVTGRFSGHLFGKRLVFVDEGTFGGDRSKAGVIKTRITDKHVILERKGVDAFRTKNRMAFIIASNEANVVPADKGDRRWMVFEVGEARKNDHAFFGAIAAQMEAGGRAVMLQDLLTRDYSIGPDPRRIIKTRARITQVLAAQPAEVRYLYRVLEEASLPQNRVEGACITTIAALTEDLHRRFKDSFYVDEVRLGRFVSETIPSVRKSQSGKFQLTTAAGKVCTRRSTRYLFPDLAIARAEFERAVGVEPDWPKSSNWLEDEGSWTPPSEARSRRRSKSAAKEHDDQELPL